MSRETDKYTDVCGNKIKLSLSMLQTVRNKIYDCLLPEQCGGLEKDCWVVATYVDKVGVTTDVKKKICDLRINGMPVDLPNPFE